MRLPQPSNKQIGYKVKINSPTSSYYFRFFCKAIYPFTFTQKENLCENLRPEKILNISVICKCVNTIRKQRKIVTLTKRKSQEEKSLLIGYILDILCEQ